MDYSQLSHSFQMEQKYDQFEEEILHHEPSYNHLNDCQSDPFVNPFYNETDQWKNVLLSSQVITQNGVLLSTNCSQLSQNESIFEAHEDSLQQFDNSVQQFEDNQIQNNFYNEQHHLHSNNHQASFTVFEPQRQTKTPIQSVLSSDLLEEVSQANNTQNSFDCLNQSEYNQQDEKNSIDNNTFNPENANILAPPAQEAPLTQAQEAPLTQAQEAAEKKKKQQESKNMINIFMYWISKQFKNKWEGLLNLQEDYCSLTKFTKTIMALNPIDKTDFIEDIINYFDYYEAVVLPDSNRIKNKSIYPKYIRAFKNLLNHYSNFNQENLNEIKRVYLKDFLLV